MTSANEHAPLTAELTSDQWETLLMARRRGTLLTLMGNDQMALLDAGLLEWDSRSLSFYAPLAEGTTPGEFVAVVIAALATPQPTPAPLTDASVVAAIIAALEAELTGVTENYVDRYVRGFEHALRIVREIGSVS